MMWNLFKQVMVDTKEVMAINAVNTNISVVRQLGKLSAKLDEKKANAQEKIANKIVEQVNNTEEAYISAFRNGYAGHTITEKKKDDGINWAGINKLSKNRK